MTNCVYCGKKDLRPEGYVKKFCDDCVKDKEVGLPVTHEKVFIKGHGYELKSRVNEVRRRVILPYERTDGKSDYYVGRRGDDGRIAEKTPCD